MYPEIVNTADGRLRRAVSGSRTIARSQPRQPQPCVKHVRIASMWSFTGAMEGSVLRIATGMTRTHQRTLRSSVARSPVDHKLVLKAIPVRFLSQAIGQATAEGNNAAWPCECGYILVGRCYYQFGDTCFTECPGCKRNFRVSPDGQKRASEVVEV
jgi:hypothetical protein